MEGLHKAQADSFKRLHKAQQVSFTDVSYGRQTRF